MIKQRTIIIGDVHGCFEELEELLRQVEYAPDRDRLMFVGDLINKGPHSLEVMQLVYRLGAEVVLGNHEQAFLDYLAGQSDYETKQFRQLKRQLKNQLFNWVDWIQSWPLYIEEDDFLVVHAGLVPGQPPAKTEARLLTNIRTWDGKGKNLNHPRHPAWFELYRDLKLVIFGHWAKRGLVVRPNALGLDTGCVYGRMLTAVILPERLIVQVAARKMYEIPQSG